MSAAPTVPDELVDGISLGIYEKALAGGAPDSGQDWRALLAQVPEAGFSFLDISIDESPRRENFTRKRNSTNGKFDKIDYFAREKRLNLANEAG